MGLEQVVRDAADKFAQTVVSMLRGMTLDEVVDVVGVAGARSTAVAPARKPRTAKVAPAKKPVAAKAVAKPVAAKPAPTHHLSPKLRAFRKIQGQYAGYLRGFTGATRERIRAINASKGAAAALAEMNKLLAGEAKTTAKKPVASKPVAAKATPKKLEISPARAAQLKVQGTYIGLIRGLPAAEKARMKKLAAKSGMKAAVEVMRGKGK